MLRELLRQKFPSNAQAARKLHELWLKDDRAAARRVTAGSLATKIGDLERGKTEWWARRGGLTEVLASLLGCSALDLLGGPVVPTGAQIFPEFPALPPLRPDEPAPRIQRGGWLLDRVLDAEHKGVRVLVAGPGMGKSFAVRRLQAGSEYAAISTPTLAGVGEHVNDPRPLVLDIDEPDPRTDAATLRSLARRRQATIVLAPFELPGVATAEAPVFDTRARASLLAWIVDRLERSERDTRLDLVEIRGWLERNDPELRLVATPADLLAFCAAVDAEGLDEATWEVRALRWLRASVRLFAHDAAPAPPVEAIADALCQANATRRENPWGALPGDVWSSLVPDDLCGPYTSRWGRAAIVHGLRAAGLLRGAAGGLVFTPTWVHHGLAAAALDHSLAGEDIDAWGLLAADESRQHLVDEALDRQTHAGFHATVRAVVRERDRRTLGLVAAREAVFAAAARRLLQEGFAVSPGDVPAWHRLVEHQIASLERQQRACFPLTRPGWDGEQAFWADAWTHSLCVPPPARFDHPALVWHFPGWVEELPPPTNVERWPSSSVDPWGASEAVQRIVRLAPAALIRLPALPDRHRCPRVLLPAIVLLAPQRGWKLTSPLLDVLPGSWESHHLVELLPQRPLAERTAIADMLWDILPFMYIADRQLPVAQRLYLLRNSEFLPFIVANLGEATLVRTIDSGGSYQYEGQVKHLLQLPRRLRRIIVRKVLAAGPGQLPEWQAARDITRLLDAEDLDLSLEIIRDSEKEVAAEFTGLVWRMAPAIALEQSLAAIAAQRPTAQAWCWDAPQSRLTHLADAMQRGPCPLPDWVAPWARYRLPSAGVAAEALFELLDGERRG